MSTPVPTAAIPGIGLVHHRDDPGRPAAGLASREPMLGETAGGAALTVDAVAAAV
jgi:hypothetical protein